MKLGTEKKRRTEIEKNWQRTNGNEREWRWKRKQRRNVGEERK